jgi:long-chain acyl-CoA synthetase
MKGDNRMLMPGDIPKLGAKRYGDKEAVVFENVRLTYGDLNERINRLANALAARGYRAGDRVAVLSQNSHKYLEIFFAAGKLGMSLVPLNFMLADDELIRLVHESEATLLMAGEGYAGRCARMKHKLARIRDWIAMDGANQGYLCYEEMLKLAPAVELQHNVDPDDMSVLAYTNGTTASPKGVMLSYKNVIAATLTTSSLMEFSAHDTGCFVLPFYKTEFFSAISILMVGGKVVINRRVDRGQILRLLQDEKCSYINMAPKLYDWLRQDPEIDQYDLSSLRVMLYSGSTFPQDRLIQCVKKFWKPFAQTYGVTETSGCSVTALLSDDHILEGPESRLLASAGKPLGGAEVKIVGRDHNPLEPGEIGELVVKGDNVMMGYWKNPDLTRQVLKEGWLRTGDMGYMDRDGYIFVLGHKTDLAMDRNPPQIVASEVALPHIPPVADQMNYYEYAN